ncbi:MAG TPA: Asp-tRNA(Asn)/Glu-tRNA(Gln) amidotransferase subunit GatA [Candidatus Andersenbacteria bacterium]|nr:Asp-tRNA(Asn)/Glu-tRNA(Gln) amidotransferase subunit GatA [Candidatus Andersenbacteria bacterium]
MTFPLSIAATQAALAAKEISPAELLAETLQQIQATNPSLNAFLEVFTEATPTAKTGRLAGIPVAIKDIICTTEGHTTASSKMLQSFRSPFDATVVQRLKDAGAVIIGKTNCDEFAMGASNEFSAYGPVKNPWDTGRVAGGSSGGSAAAVAAGEVLAALGTDTGGSLRLPASFCGVVGVKPTYGRVSRFGVIAYASSFDQVGPVARTVKDAALLLEIIAGSDQQDATSSPHPVPAYTQACGQSIAGLTIGLPAEFFGDEVDDSVKNIVTKAVSALEQQGATLKEISLPLMHLAVPTYYLLVKSEASTNLSRFDALRFAPLPRIAAGSLLQHYETARGQGFGPEVKRSILMGTYALSAGYIDAWYKQASRVRTLIRREFAAAFKEVDVIAGPVSAETAFPLGAKADDPLAMYFADLLTDPASVAGLPALSVPAGFVNSLPVGLQVIGPHFGEEQLFQVAHAYEQSQDWWKKKPEI